MKVREIFWNTKIQLSFKSSSAAALIKKLSDGNCIKFFGTSGPSFWIRTNCRWFGQRGVEKKSHKTPSFIVPKFYHASVLQQGCQTCIRCARKNSSRYKLHSEIEITTNLIGLIAEKSSKFAKKFTEMEQKLLSSVVGTKIYMSTCFFAKSMFLRQTIILENLLDFNKKIQFYSFRGFFREIFVSFPSSGKIKTLLWVIFGKETTIWLKSLKKNPIFFIWSWNYYGEICSTPFKVKNKWICLYQ